MSLLDDRTAIACEMSRSGRFPVIDETDVLTAMIEERLAAIDGDGFNGANDDGVVASWIFAENLTLACRHDAREYGASEFAEPIRQGCKLVLELFRK